MGIIKRILGIVWMLMAPAAVYFMFERFLAASPALTIPWVIILTVFTPIAAGFFVFGFYAVKGEYESV